MDLLIPSSTFFPFILNADNPFLKMQCSCYLVTAATI